MKKWIAFLIISLAALQSCGFREKEQQLAKREQQLAVKEQALMQWEQRLAVQEKELLDKKKQLEKDTTTRTDSTEALAIAGKWTVKMQCTETSCSGSAIGDSKTETWEIVWSNGGMIVNTFTGNELSRIFNGSYLQNKLEAVTGQPGAESYMRVILELKNDKMEGVRVVERSDCKIRYALIAERQK